MTAPLTLGRAFVQALAWLIVLGVLIGVVIAMSQPDSPHRTVTVDGVTCVQLFAGSTWNCR